MKKSDGRGAARGLTLDNVEDNIGPLRDASAHTRVLKKLRDDATLKKQRETRAALKKAGTRPPGGK